MSRRPASNSVDRYRSQRGQTLIMFILAFAAFSGFTAMTIDVGLIFHERRAAQNAADAAALAGVAKLPPAGTPAEAVTTARAWADKNGYENGVDSTTVTITYPYNADASKLEVTVERPVSFVFGKLLGLGIADVGARAVGQATFTSGGGGGYAIFVINNNCNTSDPLEISGSVNDITGLVHSNSKIKIGGSGNDFVGATTYSCNGGFNNSGSNNSFTPPAAQSGNRQPPLDYTYSSFPCTYSYNSDVDLGSRPEVWLNNNPSTKTLKTAVICSTGDIQLSGQDITGRVTLVAMDEIKVSGSNFDLKGNWNDVLAFSNASHDAAIDMSGSGGDWEGYIYAPNGRAKIAGSSNLSVKGSIIANRVSISGSDFSIDSTDIGAIAPGPGTTKLVE